MRLSRYSLEVTSLLIQCHAQTIRFFLENPPALEKALSPRERVVPIGTKDFAAQGAPARRVNRPEFFLNEGRWRIIPV